MGKLVLAVFLCLFGYGGYWFVWEESGANSPISVRYNLNVWANTDAVGVPLTVTAEGNISLTAKPDALKLSVDVSSDKMGTVRFETILRIDEQRVYGILPDKEVYTVEEFDLVPMSMTTDPDDNIFPWEEVYSEQTDGKWFGEDGQRYFARRHVVRHADELPAHVPVPGGVEWISENLPESKLDMWLTCGTRLGSQYVKGMNKLMRIDCSSDLISLFGLLSYMTAEGEARTQIPAKSCPYFPLPLKIQAGSVDENRKGFCVTVEAEHFSRRPIAESEFAPPPHFREISVEEFRDRLCKTNPLLGVALNQRQ